MTPRPRCGRSWPVLHFAVAVVVCAHAILYKRDVRSATGWTGLIWLAPFLGSLLYWLFGINRIRRRAVRLGHPARCASRSGDRAAPRRLAPRRHLSRCGARRRAPPQPAPPRQPDRAADRRGRGLSGHVDAIERRSARSCPRTSSIRPCRGALRRGPGACGRARRRGARADRRRGRPLLPGATGRSPAGVRAPVPAGPRPFAARTSTCATTAR